MELTNETPYPAAIFRGVIDEERLFASVVARVTYDLSPDGLQVAGEQAWEVSPGPAECEYGVMAPDDLFYRGGVDVFVLGSARAYEDRAVPYLDVVVQIGDFLGGVRVFGDRVWTDTGDGSLRPSAPRPFTEMPLDLEHAFGGADVWDELAIPFTANPKGVGFYLDKESALGRPLPNVEDARAPISSWEDRPDPVGVGLCPYPFGPRLRDSVEFDEQNGQMKRLDPTFFNAAFPGMVAPTVEPGDTVTVWGVSARGPVTFQLPAHPVEVELTFGSQVTTVPVPIDQVGIEADRHRVFVTYRYPFRYRLIPLQLRACRLLAAQSPTGAAVP